MWSRLSITTEVIPSSRLHRSASVAPLKPAPTMSRSTSRGAVDRSPERMASLSGRGASDGSPEAWNASVAGSRWDDRSNDRSIGQRSARRSNAARRNQADAATFGAGGETHWRVSRLALVPRKIRCGETRARLARARRGRRHARVPSPHTPVTLLSAAHSGSARPTPTDEANGPAGMCPVVCGPRGSRADDTTAQRTRDRGRTTREMKFGDVMTEEDF